MATFTLKRTVTCPVRLMDVGEIDPETGEVAFKNEEEQVEAARDWAVASWEEPYPAEEFVEMEATDWDLDEVKR